MILPDMLKTFNFTKSGIIFFVVFLFGILFGHILFPYMIKSALKKQINLKPGSDIRPLWEKLPFYLDFHIYLFNVTNPEEVSRGGKPNLQEIGPYFFEEWKEKVDLVEDTEEDTITFYLKDSFIFRPDLSNGLTGEEIITLPHIFIASLSIAIQRDSEALLPTISAAIKELFKPDSPMLTTKVMDLLFRGVPIDCSSQSFEAQAICSAFALDQAPGVKPLNETHYKFSVFGSKNATPSAKLTVLRGGNDARDIGRVTLLNDEMEMDTWDSDECNAFKGTDGTVFPPFLKREDGIWGFVPDLCRSIGTIYERKTSYQGIPTLRYILKFGDMKSNEKMHCYCRNPPDGCPPSGTIDLMPCSGAPMIASQPHFYDCDPSLVYSVNGLAPDKEKHSVQIDFEILTGSPLSARNRLMFSLEMEPVPLVEVMANVPKVTIPLFWIQEGIDLNATMTKPLRILFTTKKIVASFSWIMIVFGTIGTFGSVILKYLIREKLFSVKSVTPENTEPDKTRETSASEHY